MVELYPVLTIPYEHAIKERPLEIIQVLNYETKYYKQIPSNHLGCSDLLKPYESRDLPTENAIAKTPIQRPSALQAKLVLNLKFQPKSFRLKLPGQSLEKGN